LAATRRLGNIWQTGFGKSRPYRKPHEVCFTYMAALGFRQVFFANFRAIQPADPSRVKSKRIRERRFREGLAAGAP
jgi:hypothetical protein